MFAGLAPLFLLPMDAGEHVFVYTHVPLHPDSVRYGNYSEAFPCFHFRFRDSRNPHDRGDRDSMILNKNYFFLTHRLSLVSHLFPNQ